MVYEFPENWNELDSVTKEVILEDYALCLKDEGFSDFEIRTQLDMINFELEN